MDDYTLMNTDITLIDTSKEVPNSSVIYPKSCLKDYLDLPVNKERLKNKCFFGYCLEDVAEDKNIFRSLDTLHIAFSITKLWWEEKILKANINILNTIMGNKLFNMYKSNKKINYTVIGMGDVHPGRYNLIVDELADAYFVVRL